MVVWHGMLRACLFLQLWILGWMITFNSISCGAIQSPSFTKQPPNREVFHNSSGAIIPCSANGVPQPSIYWTKGNGPRISDVPGLRHVRPDGSLVFQPFRAEDYRQDVHDASYKCVASNSFGSIGSTDVHVKAVVLQEYQAHVYDEYVIRGNTAIFKCQVPSFMKEFLVVTSWTRDDGLVIVHHRNPGAKYVVLRDWELHIRNTARNDSFKQYRCRVKNLLTGGVTPSVTSGQLIVTDPTGSIPLRITSGRSIVQVKEGETAELPCVSEGYPVPTYTWYRKDNLRIFPLHLGERISNLNGTLFMDRTLPQDSGKYVCIVNNSIGEVKVDTELTVFANLTVMLYPPFLKLETGRPATLNCSITGYPIRSVSWYKDMTPLMTSNRVRLIGNQVLHIASVQRDDQGMYQCFVYGAGQTLQSSAQIALSEDAPDFKFIFSRQAIQPGERFSLRCVAGGNPLPRVTWTLDSRPIPENHRVQYGDFVSAIGEVVSFVNVSSARTDDGGLYECKAQNEAGFVMHNERVDIAGPPFIRTMGNVTVVEGDNFLYHCPMSGYPIPVVTWSKDGRELPSNERQQVYPNASFSITAVTRESDEGTYSCAARNKQGQRAQQQLLLRVIKRPVINPFTFPKILTEGMHVIVTCSVLMGDPPITVRWLKDGMTLNRKMLNIEESSLGNLGSSLVFSGVGRSHNGNYTCLAENIAGEANSTASMLVNVPPKWRIEPVDVSAVMDDSVIFDCQAEGYPQPLIRWKKAAGSGSGNRNFKSIISNYHIQTLENGSLSIKDLTKADAGFYLCEAANGVGSDLSTVVRLSVHVAAHFKTPFRVHRIAKGSKLNIQCEAFGEEPINIQWYKDRKLISEDLEPRYNIKMIATPNGKDSFLTLSSPIRTDSAVYSCTSANAYGKDSTNIQVLVEEVPDPPTDVTVKDVASRLVNLVWGVPYTGNSPISKYHLHWKPSNTVWSTESMKLETAGDSTNATVSGLIPTTTYHFKINAENSLGRSSFSEILTVTTDEEVPSEPPSHVEAVAVNSHSIRVIWKPPPPRSVNGKIRGYYVGYKILNTPDPFVYKTLEQIGNSDSLTECTITSLRRATEYAVTVQTFNNKGAGPPSKEFFIKTHENDPPPAPFLRISSATASTVALAWEQTSTDSNPVKGFKISYRADLSEWMQIDIGSEQTSYILRSLSCGTRYHFHMVAYNEVGHSDSSEVVSVTTQGNAPIAPDKTTLLDVNTTFVALNLDAWKSGGCAISFFVVQYKGKGQRDWTLVSNNLDPRENGFIVAGLSPATWYNLLMAAHNEAGTTEAEYVFATLTTSGGTITPSFSEREEGFTVYRNLSVLVPIICAIVVLLVITLVVVIVCLKKNRNPDYATPPQNQEQGGDQKGDTISMASVGKKLYEAPRETLYYPSPYATTRISMYSADSESSSGQTNSLQRPQLGPSSTRPEHAYDVPFPQKQFSASTKYSAPSHDYQALFRDTGVHQLLDPGDDDRRQIVVQRMCLQQHPDSKHRSPVFLHHTQVQSQVQQRIYRLNRHSDPNVRFRTTQDYLTEGNSEDDESDDGDNDQHQGNGTENHELSEAECDRDYQHIRKGSQSPFVKFRMSNCGLSASIRNDISAAP